MIDPLITISIVSHGDAEKVDRLLASIQKYELETARYQLILTDNLKNNLPNFDPSPWGDFHILRNQKQEGFAKNHNQAFTLARGKYFAILNPDLFFIQPTFRSLLDSLHTRRFDLIAPQIVDEEGIVQDSYRALPSPLEIIRRRMPGYTFKALSPDENGLVCPDWIAGMFWLMPSKIFRELGGMDEKFRLYFEDVDFCTRLRLRGMKLLVDSKAQVRHDAKRSSRRELRYLFLHLQSAARFFNSSVYRQAQRIR